MSTIAKLDRNVRLDRYLRKKALRELQADAKLAAELLARAPANPTLPQLHQIKQLQQHGLVARFIYLKLRKIAKDSARTGSAKELIFNKLGVSHG